MISSPIKAFEVRDDSVSIRFSCKNYGKYLRIAIDNLCDTIKGGNPENKGHRNKGHRDRYIGSLFSPTSTLIGRYYFAHQVVAFLENPRGYYRFFREGGGLED